MSCVSPPEITDIELLACVDGRADRTVQAHLEQCPHCQERAKALAEFQDRLVARLDRLTCPSPHELGEYHLGMLPGDKQEVIHRHLAECPRCTKEITLLRDYIKELTPEVEFSIAEQVKVWVARLVEQSGLQGSPGSLALAPAGAGLRGEPGGPRIYQTQDAQIVIEAQPDPQAPGLRALLGLVTGIEASGWQAHLWRENQLITTGRVDDLGNWVISGLAPGQYRLILSGPQVQIHIETLEI